MEFIDDLDLRVADHCAVATRKAFGASALAAMYHMLFVDGFVHCDMHPGNLYFTQTGHVVVLDAGFCVRLSDRLRRLFADFFLNMSLGRGIRCAEIVVESAEHTDPDADIDGFIARMAGLVDRNHRLTAKEFSLMGFATEMFDLQRRHGVQAAPELVFPLLALLVIEGTIRDLDPDVDFQQVARPVLMAGRFGRRGGIGLGEQDRVAGVTG
jgi:ubiquinone biosynthesis protein